MKKKYDLAAIDAALDTVPCGTLLRELDCAPFLLQYEKGELVTSPYQREALLQVIVSGTAKIYLIRPDGERYSLSEGGHGSLFGDLELFRPQSEELFAEADGVLLTLAVAIAPNREKLMDSAPLLRLLGQNLSDKLRELAGTGSSQSRLSERLLGYLRFRCENGILKGLENAAFHLHCSPRQLQRVLNRLEQEGVVEKQGKGCYALKP